MKVQRGHIWTINLSPTVANEQAGTRPCVVISVNRFNDMPIRHCIVVPLTSKDRRLPHHIRVKDDDGQQRPSWAMCEGIRAVSAQRLGDLIGMADHATIEAIANQVKAWVIPETVV